MMSEQSHPFLETIHRLREQSKKEGDPVPLGEHPEIFALQRDPKGRDIAIPLMTRREIRLESWKTICSAFDYTTPLPPEGSLSEYQQRLRDSLADGRKNAILYGPPGTGKTTAAMLALRELVLAGRSGKAARFSQFKTQMEPRYCDENEVSPETVAKRYSEPEFLLLDELGYGDTNQTIKEHERRIFFDLISVRDSMARKTWILSNTDRGKLHDLYGEAAFSRLDGIDRCVLADFSREPNHRYKKK